jgi:hypothetical protein
MTRFLVSADKELAERELRGALESLSYTCKMTTPGVLTVHTVDKYVSVLIVFRHFP